MPVASLHNEKELLARISEGDEEAFSVFFYHYTAQLHLHIASLIKSPAGVEEIIQETFLRVWMHRDQLTGIDYPRSWVLTIASHLCFNYLRQQVRQEKHLKVFAGTTHDTGESLQDATESKEIRKAISEAVGNLSGQRKLVWQLYREQGLKQADIARQLDISLSTVKNTIAQSLEFIRQQLREKGYWIPLCLLEAFLKIS